MFYFRFSIYFLILNIVKENFIIQKDFVMHLKIGKEIR